MATVALVNPQLAASGWRRGLRPSTMDDALPRHSLTMLSAVLRRQGHRPVLTDLRLLDGWDAYAAALRDARPEVICVTAHTSELDDALECLRRARAAVPECVTVAGGIHATMAPGAFSGDADFVIRGEGELALPRLISDPEAQASVFWGDTPTLDELPFEDRDLYPDYAWRTRFPMWNLPVPTVDLLTGRGCPYGCRFCCGPGEQNLFTKPSPIDPTRRVFSFRRRSVAHVVAELEELQARFSFRSVVFHDDQFLIGPDWVAELCQTLHARRFVARGMRWWAACRADLICRHPDLLEAMRDAGLTIVSIGFESFSNELLDWLAKGTTRDENFRAAEICRSLGIDVFANIMLGVPRSDGVWRWQDDLDTVAAIRQIRPRYVSPSYFSPVPGSWLYDWAVEHDLVPPHVPSREGTRRPSDGTVRGVDYEHLDRLVRDLRPSRWRILQDRVRLAAFLRCAPGR